MGVATKEDEIYKSKLEIGNVHIRKAKFRREKCTYWKSKVKKFKVGNEKYQVGN